MASTGQTGLSMNKLTMSPGKISGNGNRFRRRIGIAMAGFALCYSVIAGRMVMLAGAEQSPVQIYQTAAQSVSHARPDILDRNGTLLATDVRAPSLFAEPHRMVDVDEAVEKLSSVMPEMDTTELRRKLTQDRRFVWLQREISPSQREAIHGLGIPGVGFIEENQRFYPSGRLASHVVGHVDVDNAGIAGMEKHFDQAGLADLHATGFARSTRQAPERLSLDLRVQHAVRDELLHAIETFDAKAAAGVIMDARTGEIVSMVSLPDYDPHDPSTSINKDNVNRVMSGVYEMGSTLKAFTVAMALDAGVANLETTYDARSPIRVSSFTIDDFHAQRRILTVPEVFIHSSNIGTARMALQVGIEGHQDFMERMGFFARPRTELPESAKPLLPSRWTELSSMTISFGHGFSVAPIQTVAAAAALVNGGKLIPPTLVRRTEAEATSLAQQVLSPSTSAQMRHLMRLNVTEGTGKKAEVPGFRLGGKTGSAEKVENGSYSDDKLLTSFLGTFPADNPAYVVLVMIDEPRGIPETHGFRTAGWNAVPTTGRILTRIGPMLDVPPEIMADAPLEQAPALVTGSIN
jgi:cell division protein FtsI (penicillin-binding protein 3)